MTNKLDRLVHKLSSILQPLIPQDRVDMDATPSAHENTQAAPGRGDADYYPIDKYGLDYYPRRGTDSCGGIPDGYIKCTKAEQGWNDVSAAFSFADDSYHTNTINLADLLNSGSGAANVTDGDQRLEVDSEYAAKNQLHNEHSGGLPNRTVGDRTHNQLEPDPSTDYLAATVSYTAATVSYTAEDDSAIINTGDGRVEPQEETIILPPMELENSSGDSGYADRSHKTKLCLRSDSQTSCDS